MKHVRPFRRYCDRCDKLFQPSTRGCRVCEPCIKKTHQVRSVQLKKYNKDLREKKKREKDAT